ncbi:unnamed protein product [Thelazia callipaeda]|uniref:Uncharacterized protein n=1 Tax=Thelazia callipaeda TaxID=103827 RepID=A0A0N5CW01_THECL|nr:unnamed protein product [Thelazia callipaeda]
MSSLTIATVHDSNLAWLSLSLTTFLFLFLDADGQNPCLTNAAMCNYNKLPSLLPRLRYSRLLVLGSRSYGDRAASTGNVYSNEQIVNPSNIEKFDLRENSSPGTNPYSTGASYPVNALKPLTQNQLAVPPITNTMQTAYQLPNYDNRPLSNIYGVNEGNWQRTGNLNSQRFEKGKEGSNVYGSSVTNSEDDDLEPDFEHPKPNFNYGAQPIVDEFNKYHPQSYIQPQPQPQFQPQPQLLPELQPQLPSASQSQQQYYYQQPLNMQRFSTDNFGINNCGQAITFGRCQSPQGYYTGNNFGMPHQIPQTSNAWSRRCCCWHKFGSSGYYGTHGLPYDKGYSGDATKESPISSLNSDVSTGYYTGGEGARSYNWNGIRRQSLSSVSQIPAVNESLIVNLLKPMMSDKVEGEFPSGISIGVADMSEIKNTSNQDVDANPSALNRTKLFGKRKANVLGVYSQLEP